MALIPTKRDLGPLARLAERPQFAPERNFEPAANAQLAKAVSGVGDDISKYVVAQNEQKQVQQRFIVSQRAAQLDIDADNDLIDIDNKVPENGHGLTTNALTAWDKRAQALKDETPAWLRERLDPILETRRAAFAHKANGQEAERRNGWYRGGIAQSASRAQERAFNDPAQTTSARDQALADIRASGLPQAEKDKLERDVAQSVGKAKFARHLQDDPEAVTGNLGVALPGTVETRGGLVDRGRGILNYYQQRGLSPVASAGIAGALMQENSGRFDGKPGDNGISHGAAQWNGARFTGLKAFAADRGTEWTDGQTQLDYVLHEMREGDAGARRAGRELAAATTPEEAAVAMMHFERPQGYSSSNPRGGNGFQSRLRYTKMVLGGDPASGRSDTPTFDASTSSMDLPIVGEGGRTIDLDGVQPLVLDRFEALQNHWGRLLPVTSGVHDAGTNAAAMDGTKGSERIGGNALDVDVSKLSEEERRQLIGMASATGFTGIGVSDDALHLDMGPRRTWAPGDQAGSVPGWASGAVQAHLDGNPDAAAGGAPLATLGQTLDPDYATIPFSERLEMAGQAAKAAGERQKNLLAQSKATYDALKGSFEKRAVLGTVSEQDVLSSDLDDGDQATILRSIRAGQKAKSETDIAVDALLSGAMGQINPRDSTDMAQLNRGYNEVLETRLKSATDVERQAFTLLTIRQTQVLPQKVQATMEAGILDVEDPAQLSTNMATAVTIEDQVPAAFKQLDEGARKAVADYRYQTLELGRTSEQATEKILAGRSPEAKQAEALYGNAADKAVKDLKVADVTAAFEGWVYTPGSGAGVAEQNRLLREYQDAFRGAMLQTQGDSARAKAVALAQIKTTWDVSDISGSSQLMRLPPERFYPAIDGSHAYLRDDAMKTAADWLNGGGTSKRSVSNVYLRADAATAKDINANRRPSYLMAIEMPDANGDGEPEITVAPQRWVVPEASVQQMLAKRRQAAAETFRQHDQAITDRRVLRSKADAASQNAIDTSVGPDWMKARAGEIAREQTLMAPDVGARPPAVIPKSGPANAGIARLSKPPVNAMPPTVGGRGPYSRRGETMIPSKGNR